MTERKTKSRARRGSGTVFQKVPGGAWHIQYYGPHPQTGEWACLKEYISARTKTDAQAVLTDRLKRIADHETIPIGRSRSTVADLFASLIRETESEERAKKVPSRKAEGQRWTWAHLKPFFGYRQASHVTRDLAVEYRTQRLEAGAAPATVNRELATLRRILHFGRQNGKLPNDPPRMPMLPENNRRTGYIEQPIYERMCDEADKEGLWLLAFVELAYTYGWRRGELIDLRVERVNLLARTLHLYTSKNGEPRTATMTPPAYGLLTALCDGKQPQDQVFTRPGGAPVRDFRAAWQNMCICAGAPGPGGQPSRFECGKCGAAIPDGAKMCRVEGCNGERRYIGLLVHDMRRSAARALRRAGVPEHVVMDTMGHKTRSMFKRYDIGNEHDQQDAMTALEEYRRAEQAKAQALLNPPLTPQGSTGPQPASGRIQ